MRLAWHLIACSALLLTGCSVNKIATTAPVTPSNPQPTATGTITGVIHGGRQPIRNAEVFLLAVNDTQPSSGYGQSSLSLLNSTSNTVKDVTPGAPWNGWYYVPTQPNGTFTIHASDWGSNCTAGTQTYLLSYSGDPTGSGSNNTAATLLSVLGDCANFANLHGTLQINEVTTVATAYALAGFTTSPVTDPVHFSAPNTSQPTRNVINAISSFFNLVSLSAGTALTTTPSGNGIVPQQTINTLADILASCVNEATNACTTLFNNALNGYGNKPTDTATAAINIARNPGNNAANTALYGLITAGGSNPWSPYLRGGSGYVPNDFTLGIEYGANSLQGPQDLAIDAYGNVWVSNNNQCGGTNYCITELSPNGTDLSGPNGFQGGGLNQPNGLAFDSNGNLWIANAASNSGATASITEMIPGSDHKSITGATGFTNALLAAPWGVAIDANNNVWITDRDGGQLSEFSGGGFVFTSNPNDGGLNDPSGIAIDNSNNIWVANPGGLINNTVSLFKINTGGAGATADPASPLTSGSAPEKPAIDPSGNVWVANYGGTNGADSSVSYLPVGTTTFTQNYTGGGINGTYGSAYAAAVDSGGNIWTANYGPGGENPTPGSISEISGYSNGAPLSPANGFQPGLGKPISIAVDGSGNVWTVLNGDGKILELVGAASPTVTPLSSQDPAGTPY